MNLAPFIEHTNLSPLLTIREIDQLVEEAKKYSFFGVCVPPFWVQRARREIGSAPIALITVAGFPLGYNMTETKLDEMKRAIDNGADELDVVWNVTSFRTGIPWTKIEIAKCSKLAHDHEKLVKVIIETAYLDNHEIEEACAICADAGVDFVKTSTGFAQPPTPGRPTGATVEHVRLMRAVLPPGVRIKASGGIRNKVFATELIEAGADRIGSSSSVQMIEII